MAAFLLSIEAFIALVGFFYIFKRDKLFGTYFLVIFVYGIFAQIGYYYFSQFSENINAYFGKEPWYESTLTIIFSLALILILFALFWRKLLRWMPFTVIVHDKKNKDVAVIALIIVLFMFIYQSYYLAMNWNILSYFYINNLGEQGTKSSLPLFIFGFIIKLLVATTFVFYSILRSNHSLVSRTVTRLFFGLSFCLLFLCCYKLSNRTDLVALAMGIFVYEFHTHRRIRWGLILKSLMGLILLTIFLFFLRTLRFSDTQQKIFDVITVLFEQDYYPPAHMLFASVAYNYVRPLEVFLSNASNSLILLNYPFLQFGITELFSSTTVRRGASYAFYIITEGYLAMGKLGFIYNAVIITTMLAIWRRLAESNNVLFNAFLTGLMGCMLVNLARGQSSYFIKNLYMFVFPAVLLYASLVGIKLSLVMKSGRHRLKAKASKTYHIFNSQ